MAYAKKKQETENRVVKWLMQDKKIIKFNDDDTTYKLKGKVAEFDHAKYGVKTGVSVEVAIQGDEVTFMRKSENQDSKPETKKEAPKKTENKTTLTGDQCVWTISGVPTSKEVIAFKEGKVKWYQVTEELREKDWAKEGFVARARVKVTLGTVIIKEETKPCVLTMELLNEEVQQESNTESRSQESKTSANNSEQGNINLLDNPSDTWQVKQLKNKINYLLEVKQGSIERQSCWSSACQVVAAMLQGETEMNTPVLIEKEIKTLAEAGLKFVRETNAK